MMRVRDAEIGWWGIESKSWVRPGDSFEIAEEEWLVVYPYATTAHNFDCQERQSFLPTA